MKPFLPDQLPFPNLNWSDYITQIAKANAALAKYDGILEGIPNKLILLSPLMRQEAVLSSRIEGTQATIQEVMEFEADPKAQTAKYNDIQEIQNYREALSYAKRYLPNKPLGLNLIKEMHGILLKNVRGQDKNRGLFRTEQNWIGKDGCKIEQATYVPPAPNDLMPLLSNWERYFHQEEKDRLVQLAIIHAQFELIHPFVDGNGRIGRLLIPIFLAENKVLSNPVFYMSTYLESTRKQYYLRLLEISQNGDWDNWIRYFLEGVTQQAYSNIEQAKKILKLHGDTKETIDDLMRSRFAIKTIDFIFERPIFSSTEFVANSRIPRASALRALSSLKEAKLLYLVREGKGQKPAIYAFRKLIEIVSE